MPKVKTTTNTRPIVYKTKEARIYEGKTALTENQAKQLLGWREAKEDEEPHFTDREGKKIVCTQNGQNRFFQLINALTIMQEILRLRWTLNGESMVIGETGLILSAQHRLIGLVFACQEWRKNPDEYQWSQQPVLNCIIVFGISETDDVVNTIDTGRPRTLGDVIFRSDYFRDVSPKQRNELARAAAYAIKTLWTRTGQNSAMEGLKTTHAESIDWLQRHPRIVKAVRFIVDENSGSELILKYTRSLGYAAAWMWLMAASNSDVEKYLERTEKELDFTNWDKAEQFWTLLGAKDKKLANLHRAFVELMQNNAGPDERAALLAKAWALFVGGSSLAADKLTLEKVKNEYEEPVLAEFPTFGGIDRWKAESEPTAHYTPTPEQIEEEKKQIVAEARTSKKFSAGDFVYVIESEDVWWAGVLERVEKVKGKMVGKVKVGTKFAGAGNVVDVELSKIQGEKPREKATTGE